MLRPPLSVVTDPQNHILKSLYDSEGDTHRTDSNLPSSKRKRVMFDPSGMMFSGPLKLNCSTAGCGKTRDESQHAKEEEVRRNS